MNLTTVALPIEQLSSDKVFYPVRLANACSGRLVATPVPGALVLAHQGVQTQDLETEEIGVGLQLLLQLHNHLLARRDGSRREQRVNVVGVELFKVLVGRGRRRRRSGSNGGGNIFAVLFSKGGGGWRERGSLNDEEVNYGVV